MHISFTAHNTSKSTSSFGLIDYLDKENEAYENEENELDIQKENNVDKDVEFESFFDNNYSEENTNQKVNIDDVVNNIDSNRGTQNLKQSNFYMLNVSPKKSELEHMEHLANAELEKRGLVINSKNELLNAVYMEQRNELMKMQMKLYSKDLMREYANNFNREIYIDESKLPNKSEKKELEKETERSFNEYLKLEGIEIKQKASVEKSNKWIETDKLTIVGEKGNSFLAEIKLADDLKSEVFLPKKLVQEQENGKFKLPENLYVEKEKEALNKFILVDVDAQFIESKTLKNKEVVYNFEKEDSRFYMPLKMSFKENDLAKRDGKIMVSQHLLNEKKNASVKEAIMLEHGEAKDEIYKKIATDKGFNLNKRKLNVDDLLWYGKVETQRTHKPTDKYVIKNNETLKDIKRLSKNKLLNKNEIKKLESKLIRDEKDNVIRAGMKKEGMQYHVHLVVSRHDKTMQKPENKISLSPLANHKNGKMYKGADVGFNRDNFFQKGEDVFDEKFKYDRSKEESYDHYKSLKNQNIPSLSNNIKTKAKGEIKGFLSKHTGVSKIKQEISPIEDIKKQMGIAQIPTRIPKTPLELAYRVGKKIISKGLSY